MAPNPSSRPSAPAVPAKQKQHKASSNRRNKPKFVRPARSQEDQLRRYFTSLCAQIDAGYPKNAIKTSNRSGSSASIFLWALVLSAFHTVLRILPNDVDTIRTKIFLLLQTDQYKEALSLVESSQDLLGDFGKAYVLYRLHREEEAASLLSHYFQKDGAADRGALHLDAQVVRSFPYLLVEP